jgi:hypothetical protein
VVDETQQTRDDEDETAGEDDDEDEGRDIRETDAIEKVWRDARRLAGANFPIVISKLVTRVQKVFAGADPKYVAEEMTARAKRARGITWEP